MITDNGVYRGVTLYKKLSWTVTADFYKPDDYLLITSGDYNKEWNIRIDPVQFPQLFKVLRSRLDKEPQDLQDNDDLLLLINEVFAGQDQNPFNDIKAFLRRGGVQFKTSSW